MEISAAVAAELGLLTQALDAPGTDMAQTIAKLADDARLAVGSYLGLAVAITVNRERFDLTFLDAGVESVHVRTSLFVPVSPTITESITATASVALILYAAKPGALVDLAADLAWSTGRDAGDFRLDEHRRLAVEVPDARPLAAMSEVNQALGVLIGRGSAPERAERDLYSRAVDDDIDLPEAARRVLATLPAQDPEAEHS